MKRTNYRDAKQAVRDIEFSSSESVISDPSVDLSAVESVSCNSSKNNIELEEENYPESNPKPKIFVGRVDEV